jgi:hypothetical protein
MPTCFCANSDAGSRLNQRLITPPRNCGTSSEAVGSKSPADSLVRSGELFLRIKQLNNLLRVSAVVFLSCVALRGDSFPTEEAAKFLPTQIGTFKAIGPVTPFVAGGHALVNVTSAGARNYRAAAGENLSVSLVTARSDAAAYTTFVEFSRSLEKPSNQVIQREIGTRCLVLPTEMVFFKGSNFVIVKSASERKPADVMLELARQVAATLDAGEGDVPVLLKHLPDWQKAESKAQYALELAGLKKIFANQPVLDALSFAGGAEAVTAPYGDAQMVIVEFTTPQLATENDQRILEKLTQLRAQGQPLPTVYRRVGNYSVFVFNAPNDQTADQLIEQVKYEQVVQWLGDNPNLLKEAQRQYTETTLGVFVSVVKASGIAAVVCFGIGGLVGGLLFARRRAQQTSAEAYSDAGGMMRLNIDELSAELNSARLSRSKSSDKR